MPRRVREAAEPQTREIILKKQEHDITLLELGVAGTGAYFLQAMLLDPFFLREVVKKYFLTGGAAEDDGTDPAILISTGLTIFTLIFWFSDPASKLREWMLNGIKQCLHMSKRRGDAAETTPLLLSPRDNQVITVTTVDHPYVLNGIRRGVKGLEFLALQALVIGGSSVISVVANDAELGQNLDDAAYNAVGKKISYIAVTLGVGVQILAAYASQLLLRDWHYRENGSETASDILRWNNLLNILTSLRKIIARVNKFPGAAHEWLTTWDFGHEVLTQSQMVSFDPDAYDDASASDPHTAPRANPVHGNNGDARQSMGTEIFALVERFNEQYPDQPLQLVLPSAREAASAITKADVEALVVQFNKAHPNQPPIELRTSRPIKQAAVDHSGLTRENVDATPLENPGVGVDAVVDYDTKKPIAQHGKPIGVGAEVVRVRPIDVTKPAENLQHQGQLSFVDDEDEVEIIAEEAPQSQPPTATEGGAVLSQLFVAPPQAAHVSGRASAELSQNGLDLVDALESVEEASAPKFGLAPSGGDTDA